MTIKSLAILSFATIAACDASVGGSGYTKDNSPLSAQINVQMNPGQNTFIISSPQGWSCSNTIKHTKEPPEPSATLTMPLTCNNGATGTLIMTNHTLQRKIVGGFRLSNGIEGTVEF